MYFVVLFNLTNNNQLYNSGGKLIIMFYSLVQESHDYLPIYDTSKAWIKVMGGVSLSNIFIDY